ncbi:hypothetical protein SAMN05444487_104162 [Marininema mesophilum]|uniref:NADPH2:quinone reductase n=1 Tax=Marininema mesophilum TaxID=1048340 RepID=A0A1H2UNA8_9BACL|nr:hypothetical protein [Marininema mesophilum]SDW57623.1 hypothetical protein SAMN05444487_104162 [Marininema mesophilum]
MIGIGICSYRGQEQLSELTITILELEYDDVLIEVKASSVNPVDWKVREGHLNSISEKPNLKKNTRSNKE